MRGNPHCSAPPLRKELCAEEERIMTVTMRKGLLRTLGAVALGLSAAAISLGAPIAARPDDRAANEKLESLRAATRGQLRWTVSRITGAFDSVQATGEALLAVDDTSQPPEARALEFLRSHGDLLGIRFSERGAPGGLLPLRAEEEIDGFQVERVSRDGIGQTHVRLHQFYRGVPVFGAQLVVHMNELGIRGVNGNFIPGIAVETLRAFPRPRPPTSLGTRSRAPSAAKGSPSSEPTSPSTESGSWRASPARAGSPGASCSRAFGSRSRCGSTRRMERS
jgi:hypothetical protein